MTYMKAFFERLPAWWELNPAYTNVGYGDFLKNEKSVLSSTNDASTLVAYFYDTRNNETGTLKNLNRDLTYTAYWFNPLTGKYILIEEGIKTDNGMYEMPQRPTTSDWVFLITSADLGELPMEDVYTDLNPNYDQVQVTGTFVEPVAVTAIGGITYKGSKKASQTMTDNTSYLYDNDASTVWKPFIDRPTQTIIFDLGDYHKLSHLTIGTVEGTIIPRFRIEGSNDLKDWTIITNTAVRDVDNPGKASEPLTGVYRYVKVILLNAESLLITEDMVKDQPYKTYWNEETQNAYSMTEITDIAIYSNGIGTPGESSLIIGGDNGQAQDITWVWLTVMAMGTVTALVVIASVASITIMVKNSKKED